jgi:hypothetical protein
MCGVRTTRWVAALSLVAAAFLAGCAVQTTDESEEVDEAGELLIEQDSLGGNDADPDDEDPVDPGGSGEPPAGETTSSPSLKLQNIGGADPEPAPWHDKKVTVSTSSGSGKEP